MVDLSKAISHKMAQDAVSGTISELVTNRQWHVRNSLV